MQTLLYAAGIKKDRRASPRGSVLHRIEEAEETDKEATVRIHRSLGNGGMAGIKGVVRTMKE